MVSQCIVKNRQITRAIQQWTTPLLSPIRVRPVIPSPAIHTRHSPIITRTTQIIPTRLILCSIVGTAHRKCLDMKYPQAEKRRPLRKSSPIESTLGRCLPAPTDTSPTTSHLPTTLQELMRKPAPPNPVGTSRTEQKFNATSTMSKDCKRETLVRVLFWTTAAGRPDPLSWYLTVLCFVVTTSVLGWSLEGKMLIYLLLVTSWRVGYTR